MGTEPDRHVRYLDSRRGALRRWGERIDELFRLASDLPGDDSGLQQDLQGLRDKRDETENRLQQLALASAAAWGARLREMEESWSRLVGAWNTTFRKLHAARSSHGVV